MTTNSTVKVSTKQSPTLGWATLTFLLYSLVTGYFIMLAVGIVHHDLADAVPTIGFLPAVFLGIGTRALFNGRR